MAAACCYEGMPLRFLASLFDIQMRYLVYMRHLWTIDALTPHLFRAAYASTCSL